MNVHARLPKSGELKRPPKTAAELGYRMPGEFEPIDAVWLAYPTEPTTWPGCFDKACEQYNFFMSQVARFARVDGRKLPLGEWAGHRPRRLFQRLDA